MGKFKTIDDKMEKHTQQNTQNNEIEQDKRTKHAKQTHAHNARWNRSRIKRNKRSEER